MNVIDLETPLNTIKHIAPECENEEPFFITEYGKTLAGTPCYQLRLNSAVACIQYVISGSGVIICNGKIYTVSGGDTFLLPMGADQIYYSNADNRFERIWLNFRGRLSSSLMEIYGISDTVVFRNTDTLDILSNIQEVCLSAKDAEEYKRESAPLFLRLIELLSRNKENTDPPASSIDGIRLYIEEHIKENLKLSDIAEHFSFSEEHIIRLFKKNYKITPHQYIIQSKIRIAMIMLKMTEKSIEEISDELSFSDTRHFSLAFLKYIGKRPSVYRKEVCSK
jgi:AraC-like DNA-binding protein